MLFSSELVWQRDAQTAFSKAKEEKKNVMVLVEASHCRWCRKMRNQTLSDFAVKKKLQHYILVKMFRDDEEEMKALPSGHYAAPTILFMTSEKKILERVIWYFDVQDFLSYIGDVENKLKSKSVQ